MVSIAVSKMGMTEFIFVDRGIKANGLYYRSVTLTDAVSDQACCRRYVCL